MFESNFPVDKLSISYHVLYNGLKKIAGEFSRDEQHANIDVLVKHYIHDEEPASPYFERLLVR